MNQPNLVEPTLNLLKKIASWSLSFARRRMIPLLGSAVLVLIVWASWSTYDNSRKRNLVFLTGSASGSSVQEARVIKEQVEKDSSAFVGTSYYVTLENTVGYEENRERVAQEEADEDKGSLFGFAYDGFGDPENVAIVLPLDTRYLHILCRKDFYNGLKHGTWQDLWLQQREPTDAEVFSALGDGRVYLGQKGSATRQCAETVLKHFKIDPDKARCFGVDTESDLRAAFNTGHVDMGFSSTLFPSEEIAKIANDGNCILLGLGDHRDAILQENPHLVSVDFQPNAYLSDGFCPQRLKSVGARRVIICSDEVSPKAVYALAMGASKALRNRFPTIEWETEPPRVQGTTSSPLRYPVHPGAQLIKDRQGPPGQDQWWRAILATLLLWGLAELVKFANSMIPDTPPETETKMHGGTDATHGQTYDRFKDELDLQVGELERAPVPLAQREFSDWASKIDGLRKRILASNREGHLNAEQTHVLLAGIRRELTFEQELRRPQKTLRAKTS